MLGPPVQYDLPLHLTRLPQSPPLALCDHLTSHTRPDTANIADLALKVVHYGEIMTPSYSSENLSSSPRRLIDTTAAGADPPWMTPSALMCRSDRGSCTHATPMPLVTSFLHTHTLKILERFYWWVRMEDGTRWWARCCRKWQERKSLAKQIAG